MDIYQTGEQTVNEKTWVHNLETITNYTICSHLDTVEERLETVVIENGIRIIKANGEYLDYVQCMDCSGTKPEELTVVKCPTCGWEWHRGI